MENTQDMENNRKELEKPEMEKATGGAVGDYRVGMGRLSSGPFCPHCQSRVDMTPCGGGVYKCTNTRCSYYGKEQQSGDLIWD